MDTLDRIRQLGFRKWYERQLVLGHAYLVVCIGGMMLVAVAGEIYAERHTPSGLAWALLIGVTGVLLGIVGWERYRRIMVFAEHLGNHAVCQRCQAYGRFQITEAGSALRQEPIDIRNPEEVWLRVHCRKCGNEWRM